MYSSSYWAVPETEDDIEHYGVKGMKWGVRKKRGLRGYRERKSYPNASKDYARSAKLSRKKMHELSNSDLTFMKNRLDAERNYKKALVDRERFGKKICDALKHKGVETLATTAVSVGSSLALAYAAKHTSLGPYLPKVGGEKQPKAKSNKLTQIKRPKVIKVYRRTKN